MNWPNFQLGYVITLSYMSATLVKKSAGTCYNGTRFGKKCPVKSLIWCWPQLPMPTKRWKDEAIWTDIGAVVATTTTKTTWITNSWVSVVESWGTAWFSVVNMVKRWGNFLETLVHVCGWKLIHHKYTSCDSGIPAVEWVAFFFVKRRGNLLETSVPVLFYCGTEYTACHIGMLAVVRVALFSLKGVTWGEHSSKRKTSGKMRTLIGDMWLEQREHVSPVVEFEFRVAMSSIVQSKSEWGK